MPAFRTLLFVPGNRPDRFAKALDAGADIVCVDLEDAVGPADKEQARAAALGFLAGASGTGPQRCVRLNALKTLAGLRDLAAVAAARPAAGLLMLPKVDAAEELRVLDAVLGEAGSALRLIALIETLRGVEDAVAIAGAAPRLAALLFGGVDLAGELGVAPADAPLAFARARLVHAARLADIEVLDVPTLEVRDPAVAAADAAGAKRLGFTGKAVLHPMQVAGVNAAFTPSPAEVAQATRILALFADSPGGVAVLDGRLVEKPVARAAERVLARARAAGLAPPA